MISATRFVLGTDEESGHCRRGAERTSPLPSLWLILEAQDAGVQDLGVSLAPNEKTVFTRRLVSYFFGLTGVTSSRNVLELTRNILMTHVCHFR